jgi:cell division septation protein DedD
MKKLGHLFATALLSVFIIQACGPSESELREREQARLDSLERVRVERVEQARLDSASAVQQRIAEQERIEAARRTFNFVVDGSYAVQVGSWRSETTADASVATWKERGYPNAYTVKFGSEETGDVWFRVRIGRVATEEEAVRIQSVVMEDFGADAWVSRLR